MAKTIRICPRCRTATTAGTLCNTCAGTLIQTQMTDIYWGKCTEEQKNKHITELAGEAAEETGSGFVPPAEIPKLGVPLTEEAIAILRKSAGALIEDILTRMHESVTETGEEIRAKASTNAKLEVGARIGARLLGLLFGRDLWFINMFSNQKERGEEQVKQLQQLEEATREDFSRLTEALKSKDNVEAFFEELVDGYFRYGTANARKAAERVGVSFRCLEGPIILTEDQNKEMLAAYCDASVAAAKASPGEYGPKVRQFLAQLPGNGNTAPNIADYMGNL